LKGKTQPKRVEVEEEEPDDFVSMQPPRKKKFEWSEPVSVPSLNDDTSRPKFSFPVPQENPFIVVPASPEKKDVAQIKKSPMKHSPFKMDNESTSPVMARRVLDTQPGFSFGSNSFVAAAPEPQPILQPASLLFHDEHAPIAEKPASTQGLAALKARVLCKCQR
jgi:hypothetical protein